MATQDFLVLDSGDNFLFVCRREPKGWWGGGWQWVGGSSTHTHTQETNTNTNTLRASPSSCALSFV